MGLVESFREAGIFILGSSDWKLLGLVVTDEVQSDPVSRIMFLYRDKFESRISNEV